MRRTVALAVIALSTSAFAQCNPSTMFATPSTRYDTGVRPISLTIDDMNGDGLPDIVTGNLSGTVSILLANGDGSFQTPQSFDAGNAIKAVAVADLNGDGIADFVAANDVTNRVSVLLGNGDGTYQILVRCETCDEEDKQGPPCDVGVRPCDVGDAPESVAIADVNHDGVQDIVTANAFSNDVSVLLGMGDGTFQVQQRFSAGIVPYHIEIADLDGDSLLDIVTSNQNSFDMSVLLGNGDGTFQTQQRFGAGFTPQAFAIGDLNADDIPDLAVANFQGSTGDVTEGTVSVLLGNGDGSFQPQQHFDARGAPVDAAIADLDEDGIPDIAVLNTFSDNLSVLLGNGDGSFQPERSFFVGNAPVSLAIRDLDGSGVPDVAIALFTDNDASVLLNQCPASAPCTGDCDKSGTINFADLVAMLFEFGTPGVNPGCDADESGLVNFGDLVAALFLFGPCP